MSGTGRAPARIFFHSSTFRFPARPGAILGPRPRVSYYTVHTHTHIALCTCLTAQIGMRWIVSEYTASPSRHPSLISSLRLGVCVRSRAAYIKYILLFDRYNMYHMYTILLLYHYYAYFIVRKKQQTTKTCVD